MQDLPNNLYRVASVVQLEQIAINQFNIPTYELMQRAGQAVLDVIKAEYPSSKKILVLCGAGNNAGDGYVVARLAKQDGYDVRVVSFIDPMKLTAEALTAYNDWSKIGATSTLISQPGKQSDILHIAQSDVIIDALLGTGLKRKLSEQWCSWIQAVNASSVPVISVDIPSGLYADTGGTAGESICANTTLSFIGLKQGMFTAQAKDYCGEILFSDLGLPVEIYSEVMPDAQLIKAIDSLPLPERKASSHKGNFGHVLIVGGNTGMPGAVILAARAALRSGAGLVTIITIKQHLAVISNALPEAMIKVCVTNSAVSTSDVQTETNVPTVEPLFEQSFISNITHVAVGMGLGQDEWALSVLKHCLLLNKPVLIDADGLNLLAENQMLISSMLSTSLILTPHPGEAAHLLSSSLQINAADIQSDRFTAIKKIASLIPDRIPCAVVLKGSGTLIYDGGQMKICSLVNAAMAAPGMGDVLSGIIIALQAQNYETSTAVELGVCVHATAAQSVTGENTRGLLASDVVSALPEILCNKSQ